MVPRVDLDCVTDLARAGALLDPLRLRILGLAQQPSSASELAKRLRLPRQRVNYHVRELARFGFLRPAGRRRKRNMFEQRYVAVARGFLLSPTLLEPVAADWRTVSDPSGAGYLVALAAQVQADLMGISKGPERSVDPMPPLSLKSQFRFESPRQRDQFARELRNSLVQVIAKDTSPNLKPDGKPGPGRPYRLVLACYPYTLESAPPT